jgi:hypothetical protein
MSLRELMARFIESAEVVVKVADGILRPFGARLLVSVVCRLPEECEDCVDYHIVIRLLCEENREICRALREQIRRELEGSEEQNQ